MSQDKEFCKKYSSDVILVTVNVRKYYIAGKMSQSKVLSSFPLIVRMQHAVSQLSRPIIVMAMVSAVRDVYE